MLGLAVAALITMSADPPSHAAAPSRLERAQQALIALGYKPGPADGAMGQRTRSALRSFQHDYGLRPTGKLDARTLSALNIQEAEPPPAIETAAPAVDSSGTIAPTNDSGSGVLWGLLIIGIGAAWIITRRTSAKAASTRVQQISYQAAPAPSPFTRPSAPSSLKSRGQTPAKWVSGQECATVCGHAIGGMIYVGGSLALQNGYGNENCLIDPSLDVSASATNDDGASIPYYPSFTFLDSASRLSMLKWLEGGRNDASVYIGYVFIYFYGLERRLLLDDPGDEAPLIIAEVERLLDIYRDNHSFDRYASALLSAAAAKFNLPIAWPPPSLRKTGWRLTPDILLCAGRAVASKTPLTADQMLTWYNAHPDKRLPPVAGRCPDEFRTLFASRFNEKFSKGLIVDPPKRRLNTNYRAASASFSVDIQNAGVPDVSGLIAPLNQLDPLVQSCAADLATYARLVGKAPSPKQEFAAAAALPSALSATLAAQPLAKLKEWLDVTASAPVTAIPARTLLERIGIACAVEGRIGKSDFALAADVLARCDFGLEPDPATAYMAPAITDDVVIFRAQAGGRLETIRPEFLGALAHVHIGMLIAGADGTIAPEEVQVLQNAIFQNQDLQAVEQRRLVAQLALLAKNPPTSRILSRFKDRTTDERETIARLAVRVAAADGRLAVEELRLLEKVYQALKIPVAHLYQDLHESGVQEDAPPTVASADPATSIPIPPRPVATNRNPVALDKDRLARTRADTAIVSSILGEIFQDEEASTPTPKPVTKKQPASATATYPGLDEKYVPLLTEIAEQTEISRHDFEGLAAHHNLMCDGAIETLNDWAYTMFDDPLLDDGETILVHGDLLKRVNREAA